METVKILDGMSNDSKPVTDSLDSQQPYSSSYPSCSPPTSTAPAGRSLVKLKAEPVWQYEAACPEFSPQQNLASIDNYDQYSVSTCSPQSSLSTNDWSSGVSESEDSPIKYTASNSYQYLPQSVGIPAIGAALAHCH